MSTRRPEESYAQRVTPQTRQVAPALDAVVRRALADLTSASGVHRAGLALVEGGGRRLRFTASGRADDVTQWCHIDAYDDVPLTSVVRTGKPVSGTLADLEPRFPHFVRRQADGPTVALVSVPVVAAGQVLGGVVLFLDRTGALAPTALNRWRARSDQLGVDLRACQYRSLRDDAWIADQGADPGILIAEWEMDGHPAGVAPARRFLSRTMDDAGIGSDLIDTAVLCLSEIATNAVMHTGAAAQVRVTVDGNAVTVAVRDRGSHRGDRPGMHDDDDPFRVHGRGLQLVEALASRWGAELDAVGATVWFSLDLQ